MWVVLIYDFVNLWVTTLFGYLLGLCVCVGFLGLFVVLLLDFVVWLFCIGLVVCSVLTSWCLVVFIWVWVVWLLGFP